MNRAEAEQRARLVFGPSAIVTPTIGSSHRPGVAQWWVRADDRTHALDVLGAAACHPECRALAAATES